MFINKAIFFFGQEETPRDLCETKGKQDMLSQRVPRASRTELLPSQSHFTQLLSNAVL